MINLRLDVVLSLGEEVADFDDVEDGAEDAEVEDEVRVGDWEGVGADEGNVSTGSNFRYGVGDTLVWRGLTLPDFG